MVRLKNSIIQICKYRITATQDETTMSRLCTDEDKNDKISRYEGMGYTVSVEEFDTTSELWLDGLECESIQQAREWAERGETEVTKMLANKVIVDALIDGNTYSLPPILNAKDLTSAQTTQALMGLMDYLGECFPEHFGF